MDRDLLGRLFHDHVRELSTRYARALQASGSDAVVIHSGSLKKRTDFDDQYWPLRVTPHFQHWAPLAEPDCAIVVVPGKKPVLAWPRATSFWEKPPPPETDHFLAAFDVVRPASPELVREHLPGGRRVAYVGEDLARAESWKVPDAQKNPGALVKELDGARAKKTAYEVLCLEEANRRAALGHDAVRAAFLAGDASELDLHLSYLRATRQDDPETPYKNIVALGPSGATLHHVSYGKAPCNAESLLLDAGATYQGYGSDVTRTWVKGTSAAADAFAAIVSGMEAMQKRLCLAVAVGRPYEQLHDESHRQLSAILKDLGLVKLGVDEIASTGISRAFYPHGLGHSLGLQTHDVGCALVPPKAENPFLRNTSVIDEAQVFTIEPGLYFIDGLLEELRAGPRGSAVDWTLVGALSPFGGVRIEDDLVVLSKGRPARNLTREVLPKGGGR